MQPHDASRLVVLYEDNHLLVVNKPCGLATMGDGDKPTLHSLASAYLKHKYNKPHGVYVGIVSRLDSMTSGVIVLARTSKAAARLNAQFADHAKRLAKQYGSAEGLRDVDETVTAFRKVYLAVVRPEPRADARLPDDRRMFDFLYKDDASHRMRTGSAKHEQAKPASLIFQTLAAGDHHRVVAVAPLTGRKHQIRVQFAARGWPILGDRKYGSVTPWDHGIALHSSKLTIEHPTLRRIMTFHCPPPPSWAPVQTKELKSQLKHHPLTAIPRASGKPDADGDAAANSAHRVEAPQRDNPNRRP